MPLRQMPLTPRSQRRAEAVGYVCGICGWLSKLWPPFGYPKYSVPYYNRDPKRDHDFDNHPYVRRHVTF